MVPKAPPRPDLGGSDDGVGRARRLGPASEHLGSSTARACEGPGRGRHRRAPLAGADRARLGTGPLWSLRSRVAAVAHSGGTANNFVVTHVQPPPRTSAPTRHHTTHPARHPVYTSSCKPHNRAASHATERHHVAHLRHPQHAPHRTASSVHTRRHATRPQIRYARTHPGRGGPCTKARGAARHGRHTCGPSGCSGPGSFGTRVPGLYTKCPAVPAPPCHIANLAWL